MAEAIFAAVEDRATQVTQDLIAALFGSPAEWDFAVRLWNGQLLAGHDGVQPRFTLVLTHPGALRRMFLPPGELTLGEAYLRGDFDVEGDLTAAIERASTWRNLASREWLRIARGVLSLPATVPPQVYLHGRQRARLHGARHSLARDRAAIRYHYDHVGTDFYRLFLDRRMVYSCAYFPSATSDLDSAQTAKLDHICRKLRLRPGERLLDIGCGWGGLVIHAAEKYGARATGVTLSAEQVRYARAWSERAGLHDRVQVELRHYRDLDPSARFDKVASVGMFAHVGRARLPDFFGCAYRALRPGGLCLVHGVGVQYDRPGWLKRRLLQYNQFTHRYFTPDTQAVQISEGLTAAEHAGFEIRDVESLREHYALTLRHWIANLEARRADAVQVADERSYRTWRMYMAVAAVGFDRGLINVFHMLLSKSRSGVAELPLTRADLYQYE